MRISDWSSDVCSSDLLLAGVGDAFQPEIAGAGEDAFELRRRMADLRRIEADPGDATQPRQGRVERRLCLRLAEVAEETEDQPGGQAVAVAGLVECAGDPGDHRVEGDAARRVALRIEIGRASGRERGGQSV